MSKNHEKNEPKFSRDALIASKALACYQRDFVGVVLTKSEYTLEEAKAEIEKALKKEA